MLLIMIISSRNPSFIEVYDNVLSPKECQRAIELFETSPQRRGGVMFSEQITISDEHKKDIELCDKNFQDGSEITDIVWKGLKKGFSLYKKKYSGGLTVIGDWHVDLGYNVQKYTDETDGYHVWHTEQSGPSHSNRIFVWMIDLNNAKSGTDFLYHPRVRAKEGRCVIWPAAWTHTHKSQTPNKGLKYLATGWVSFLP